jgi:hypothetical protein
VTGLDWIFAFLYHFTQEFNLSWTVGCHKLKIPSCLTRTFVLAHCFSFCTAFGIFSTIVLAYPDLSFREWQARFQLQCCELWFQNAFLVTLHFKLAFCSVRSSLRAEALLVLFQRRQRSVPASSFELLLSLTECVPCPFSLFRFCWTVWLRTPV